MALLFLVFHKKNRKIQKKFKDKFQQKRDILSSPLLRLWAKEAFKGEILTIIEFLIKKPETIPLNKFIFLFFTTGISFRTFVSSITANGGAARECGNY